MDFALFLYDDLVLEDAAARAEQHRPEDPEWPVDGAHLPLLGRSTSAQDCPILTLSHFDP
jgi:hypothetical protein